MMLVWLVRPTPMLPGYLGGGAVVGVAGLVGGDGAGAGSYAGDRGTRDGTELGVGGEGYRQTGMAVAATVVVPPNSAWRA